MGQAIARLAGERDDIEVAGLWGRGDDLDELLAGADVVIDFSLPEGTMQVLDAASRLGKPVVCGVTGLDETQQRAVEAAGKSIPVLYASNTSLGIAVLDAALRQVAGSLGPDYAVRIDETHHIHKKDAPSGTAVRLAETVASARGMATADVPVSSERRGEVPGDHSVTFESPDETLVLSHSVTTRDVFAAGALRAATWLAGGRGPGLYSIRDVLFGET